MYVLLNAMLTGTLSLSKRCLKAVLRQAQDAWLGAVLAALGYIISVMHVSVAADVQIRAVHHANIAIALCVAPDASDTLKQVALTIKADLLFSDQCEVSIVPVAVGTYKEVMKTLGAKGYMLALCLQEDATGNYRWQLWDVASETLLEDHGYKKRGMVPRGWGHNIADMIWPVMMGNPGFFSSCIAYCKEVILPDHRVAQHICMADFDGSHERIIIATPQVNIAPRFNRDQTRCMLYFSQYTPKNMRLMRIDIGHHKTRVVSDFDGVNMLPSFSADGMQAVYCASQGLGSCDIYFLQKGMGLKKLTDNGCNNFSPVLSDDGSRMYYCSDVTNGAQRMYCYELATGTQTQLVTGAGDVWSPAYHEKKHALVYCKKVKDAVQLFVYDEERKTHAQLTFSEGHKDMCSWSPCGNYVVFCKTTKHAMQIVCLNRATGQERAITAATMRCSFPTWSPLYDVYEYTC